MSSAVNRRHSSAPPRTGRATGLAALLLAAVLAATAATPLPALAVGEGGQAPDGARWTWDVDPSVYEARLLYHQENRGDLRISPIAASDRRRAIPNDSRPPRVTEPVTKLPPRPASTLGVVRRVALPEGEMACALTFDLCELDNVTTGFDADIVTWLQDRSIPATLFMGGKWMRTHARRVREVMRDPLFEIGNHAWTHGNFGVMDEDAMRLQVLATQAQYEAVREQARLEAGRVGVGGGEAGIPPAPVLFRFPYGRSSERALQLLAENGLVPIQWDVVAEIGGSNASLKRGRAVAEKVTPGSILLFHANLVPTGSFQLLRYVVGELERRGYRFVTVGELLSMGEPEIVREGYFSKPGDNLSLDGKFGVDGTGAKKQR